MGEALEQPAIPEVTGAPLSYQSFSHFLLLQSPEDLDP